MLEGKTKITLIGNSRYLLLPDKIFTDSAFPFNEDEELLVTIKENKLVIEENNNKR